MLPQQPLGRARFTCLHRLERRREQINHRSIQRFRSDHRSLFDVHLEKMKKKPVPAQQLPFLDRELRNKTLIELRVRHRLQADLKTMPGSMSSIMEIFSARCKPEFLEGCERVWNCVLWQIAQDAGVPLCVTSPLRSTGEPFYSGCSDHWLCSGNR